MRPVSSSSAARDMPTRRGSVHVLSASGTTPRRTKTKPIRALSAAIRMSHCIGSVAPTPTAAPLMAAMIGFRTSHAATARRGFRHGSSAGAARSYSVSAARSKDAPPRARSAPAQNPLPAPVTTMARTASSASQRAKASCSSRPMVGVYAFSRSGRFRVITATPSATSSRISRQVSDVSSPAMR